MRPIMLVIRPGLHLYNSRILNASILPRPLCNGANHFFSFLFFFFAINGGAQFLICSVTCFTSNRNRYFASKSHLVRRVERGEPWNDACTFSLAVVSRCTSKSSLSSNRLKRQTWTLSWTN